MLTRRGAGDIRARGVHVAEVRECSLGIPRPDGPLMLAVMSQVQPSASMCAAGVVQRPQFPHAMPYRADLRAGRPKH